MDNRRSGEHRILVSGSVKTMTNSDPRRADLQPPVLTDLDLERLWRAVLEPLGFSTRRLWVMMIDADNRPVPQLTEIDDVPYELDDRPVQTAPACV